jgi:glyoxylase-like metal-dependent hydrolase (beta-lactamase superfamily II)
MKREIVLGALLVTGVITISVAAVQQAPAPMTIETDKLKDNLYVFKGGGGNTAVFITANGVVVVDTKNPGWGKPILDKIKTITDKPVTTIINTHTHGDHVSGNVEFPATVEVIVQENTAKYMQENNPVYSLQTGEPGPSIFQANGGRGLPKRTFKDKMTVGRGADQIDLYYFGRAHTGGDAYVVFPSLRVMHVGDTFPNRDLPIMDRNNGGSGVEYADTLAKAAALPDLDTLINGHNATTTTPADMKMYASFIREFVTAVQSAKKNGKTLDDVVNAWKTPAAYTGYNPAQAARVRADAQVIWDETK